VTEEMVHQAIQQELHWDNLLYQILAEKLKQTMAGRYEWQHIFEAIAFWHRYSTQVKPVFRKYGSFMAALEFLIVDAYGFDVTQEELAKLYDVSTATISKRYREMIEYVDLDLDN